VTFGKRGLSKTYSKEKIGEKTRKLDFVHRIVHTQKENSPEKGYILAPFARVAPTP
jgi:hypothetical protein